MWRIFEILKRFSFATKDVLLLSILSGVMVHFHLFVGGAILLSILGGLYFSMRGDLWRTLKMMRGKIPAFFLFLIFVFPFLVMLYYPQLLFGALRRSDVAVHLNILRIIPLFIAGLSSPSILLHYILTGEFKMGYVFFSLLPCFLWANTIYFIIKTRKGDRFARFVLGVIGIYCFFSFFAGVSIQHINYILLFLPPFILPGLRDGFRHSVEKLRWLCILGILCNFIQCEMLRHTIKNSSFSLSIHQGVLKYMKSEGIERIYNLTGRYGYEFIGGEDIENIDFWDYLKWDHNPYKISLSLLLAKGGVIMVERFRKEEGMTTGIGLEEVKKIGKKLGLEVLLLKSFPESGRPLIFLAKVIEHP